MAKKSLVGLVLAAIVGLGAYFTDGDVSAALKVALDKDAAKAECAKLLEAE